jgi:hypothetical protein
VCHWSSPVAGSHEARVLSALSDAARTATVEERPVWSEVVKWSEAVKSFDFGQVSRPHRCL